MTLLPRSIQGRMLVLSAIATLLGLAIAGVVIAGVLGRFVTQGIDRRLDAELTLMATLVTRDGTIDRARLAQVAGVLDAEPGWRWRVEGRGGTAGSQESAFTHDGPPPPPVQSPHARGGPRPIEGHDRNGEAMHARRITIATDTDTVVLTAAAPRDVIDRPVRSALVPLLGTLALLGTILAIAAITQIRFGLRPVRRLRDAVGAIRSGKAQSIDSDQPAELRPLAEELNALIRDNDAALATARASAANLAHALKTPVATLALELHDDPALSAQVARIDTTIRHHLARARSATAATRATTEVDNAIHDLVHTITRLRADRGIELVAKVPPDMAVAIDPADFDELAGNLIDNAVRYARLRVVIIAVREGRTMRLSVSDDGPGIPVAQRASATAPGIRLDERSDGHGFGLAIARELAELHGGALTLDDAPGGGLVATVTLPMAASMIA